MWQFLNHLLVTFRPCFSRQAAFRWFVVGVLGLILRQDHLGITSFIRSLSLQPSCYESLVHFFHANSWSLTSVRQAWLALIAESDHLMRLDGKAILVGDGIKVLKEGRKMPSVKKLHQESENSAKASFIFGHHFGVIGVLVGRPSSFFCTPLTGSIQDGDRLIRQWKDPDHVPLSHVCQLVKDGCAAADITGPSFLVMDRYFLSRDALQVLVNEGHQQVTLITKAKKSVVAYDPPPEPTGKRGRPRRAGEKRQLMREFQLRQDQFVETTVPIYGKQQPVSYYVVNALWGQGLYHELRFVLVRHNGLESILVSTDLTLSAETIITLYSYRFKIETAFRALKQTLAGFSYHFWSKSLNKLDRFAKKTDETPLEKVTTEKEKQAISRTFDAIERFVQLAFIAQGACQLIALTFPKEVLKTRWLRTPRALVPSEATVSDYFKQTFFLQSQNRRPIGILQLIREKQWLDNEELEESSA